uniref:hypothetical protein n=1 Tax=Halomonas sp. TaxID=1486246 RepID=UPI00262A9F80|nr:hypothetical protein [Halomonas sp.]
MNRKEGLDDLATRISALVNELPNDGRERAMTVTVGGDNHGNITFGNHITINTAVEPPEQERPLTDADLRAIKHQATRQQRHALIRSYINVPFVLMTLIAAGVIASLLSGHLWQLVNGGSPWLVPAVFGAVFMPIAYWAAQLKRREQPLIREAKDTLEYVRQMQHRRRVT